MTQRERRWDKLWKMEHEDKVSKLEEVLKAEPGLVNSERDSDEWTLLRWATWDGHEECVRMLLATGADQTIIGLSGWTPMMGAAIAGKLSIVKLLYEHPTGGEAVARLKNYYGQTALACARENNKDHVVVYLETKERETAEWCSAIDASFIPDIADLVKGYLVG